MFWLLPELNTYHLTVCQPDCSAMTEPSESGRTWSAPGTSPVTNEQTDPLEEMLDRTGCKQTHYSLSECMFEHRDWRKCQHLVNDLRNCMLEYEQRKHQAEATKINLQ